MPKYFRIVVTSLVIVLFGYPAASDEPGAVHLPDLRTLTPSDFVMDIDGDGRRLLRFGNTIWNSGDGPLELRPRHDQTADVTYALQQLFSHDETGDFQVIGEREAGVFEFHEEHDHWHFSDFALYSLVKAAADGSMSSEVVAVSDKISFCMFDQYAIGPNLEHAAPSVHYTGQQCYTTGGRDAPQGYSVGWGDEYAWNFPGQSIDVTAMPDGKYWLRSIADPSDLVDETDELNNGAAVPILLRNDRVSTVTSITGQLCRPCGRTTLRAGHPYQFAGNLEPAIDDAELTFSYRRRDGGSWKPVRPPGARAAFTAPGGRIVSTLGGAWNVTFVAERRGRWVLRMKYPSQQGFEGSAVAIHVRVRRSG